MKQKIIQVRAYFERIQCFLCQLGLAWVLLQKRSRSKWGRNLELWTKKKKKNIKKIAHWSVNMICIPHITCHLDMRAGRSRLPWGQDVSCPLCCHGPELLEGRSDWGGALSDGSVALKLVVGSREGERKNSEEVPHQDEPETAWRTGWRTGGGQAGTRRINEDWRGL